MTFGTVRFAIATLCDRELVLQSGLVCALIPRCFPVFLPFLFKFELLGCVVFRFMRSPGPPRVQQ